MSETAGTLSRMLGYFGVELQGGVLATVRARLRRLGLGKIAQEQ